MEENWKRSVSRGSLATSTGFKVSWRGGLGAHDWTGLDQGSPLPPSLTLVRRSLPNHDGEAKSQNLGESRGMLGRWHPLVTLVGTALHTLCQVPISNPGPGRWTLRSSTLGSSSMFLAIEDIACYCVCPSIARPSLPNFMAWTTIQAQ